MILLKSEEQISRMKVAGYSLSCWMTCVIADIINGKITTGIKAKEHFEDFFSKKRLSPSLVKNIGFPFIDAYNSKNEKFGHPICVSINDGVVHCAPNKRIFQPGDVITLDAGLSWKGLHADMARTIIYPGKRNDKASEMLTLIEKCSDGISQMLKPGLPVKEISNYIHSFEEYTHIVYAYGGHGIGMSMHEEPYIPNHPGQVQGNPILRAGMAICPEPMFVAGSNRLMLGSNGWDVYTEDGLIAVHMEDTYIIESNEIIKTTGELI